MDRLFYHFIMWDSFFLSYGRQYHAFDKSFYLDSNRGWDFLVPAKEMKVQLELADDAKCQRFKCFYAFWLIVEIDTYLMVDLFFLYALCFVWNRRFLPFLDLISARNRYFKVGYAWCRDNSTYRRTNDVDFYLTASRNPSKKHIIPSRWNTEQLMADVCWKINYHPKEINNLEITRLIKLMLKYLGFLLICLLGWLEVGLDTPSVSWLGYWADAPSVSWLGSWADSSVFWVSSKSKCLGRSELKFSIALITSFSCHAGKRPRHLIKLSLSSLWQSNRSS